MIKGEKITFFFFNNSKIKKKRFEKIKTKIIKIREIRIEREREI